MTGAGNNTYLIVHGVIGESGDRRIGGSRVLIDAGVGAASHLDALASALGGRPLDKVIVTHGHADHASGVPAIRERWPDIEVLKYFPDGVIAGGWTGVADGDLVLMGNGMGNGGMGSVGTLLVLVTPGHALDHICLFDAAAGDLYVGDMVVAGTTVFVPPRAKGGGLTAYLQSLARLRDLNAARLLPGHGLVINRPRERITEIIEHRLMREAQVLACVEDGVTEAPAIVARVYEGLADALKPFAEQTVLAHLEKLAEDGLPW